MDWGNHLHLPDRYTEQEPDLPAVRFRPGMEHETKSTSLSQHVLFGRTADGDNLTHILLYFEGIAMNVST